MWVIAKYKSHEFDLFTNSVRSVLPNASIYRPCFAKDHKKLPLLGTYCFVNHSDLNDETNLFKLKYKRGVNYFLNNCNMYQASITNFIQYLQSYEDSRGLLQPKFFFQYLSKRGVFLDGPLKSLIFNVLHEQKKVFTISIEGSTTPIVINKEKVAINFL